MASTTKGDASTGALSDVVKELSQHKNDLNKYTTYMNVVRNCMNFYSAHMSKFYTFEQDMVMGEDEETVLDYSNIKDKLSAFLKDEDVIIQNKLRLIMLFVFSMNGVSEDVINKLVEDAQLSQEHKQTILNSNKLCINCIVNINYLNLYCFEQKKKIKLVIYSGKTKGTAQNSTSR